MVFCLASGSISIKNPISNLAILILLFNPIIVKNIVSVTKSKRSSWSSWGQEKKGKYRERGENTLTLADFSKNFLITFLNILLPANYFLLANANSNKN